MIELIIVIVILGVLAATALPKFLEFRRDARVATITKLKGDIVSAASMVNGQCYLSTRCWGVVYPVGFTINGTPADLVNGYPAAKAGFGPNAEYRDGHIGIWIKADGFNIIQPDGWTLKFHQPVNGLNLDTCAVIYREASPGSTTPNISVDTTGC